MPVIGRFLPVATVCFRSSLASHGAHVHWSSRMQMGGQVHAITHYQSEVWNMPHEQLNELSINEVNGRADEKPRH